MNNRSFIALQTLCKHYHPDLDVAVLLKYFPDAPLHKEQAGVVEGFSTIFFLPSSVIHAMHYSWLMPLFQYYKAEYHPWLATCLTSQQKAGLQQMMQVQWPEYKISYKGAQFFYFKLFQALGSDKPMPISFFPVSKLNALIHLKKSELILLIDLLSMHDLAAEMRQITDSKVINKIRALLSKEQSYYLNICLRQKDMIEMSRLNFANWHKSSEELKRVLHYRGISRLAWALSCDHFSLLWYISRRLDVGRGMLLQCAVRTTGEAWIRQIFQDQVAGVLKLFTPSSKKL